ncbi:Sec-independent protein translocase protein TatB [Sphingomonas sp. MMS24-J45]|uniref:Sec-independent protein translocase protein TatB n=1 Tax=Sphingomonas sp. MMS24-J45 TaxID=3238806 RepID=UPI00384ADE08
MFDVASSEVIVLGVVALLVIPPKDLPKAMRMAGHWIGKVRGVANQFRSGFDTMLRESELQEMEKKWAAENARIMREHPPEPVHMLPMAGLPEDAHEAHDGADAAPVLTEAPVITSAAPAEAEPHQPATGAQA